VEVVSALARRFRRGNLGEPELEAALATAQSHIPNRFELIEITEETIVAAVGLAKKHGLRAYDALQLAAALNAKRVVFQIESIELTLVSADSELNAAAGAEGLNVEDPNTH
jgi:uncharacterized protein